MANFVALAHLDVFDLVASLPKRMGGFNDAKPRILSVVLPNGEGSTEDWVELRNLLARIESLGDKLGGVEFGGVFLEQLDPNICLSWRRKSGDYYERHSRLYLPLRTNPAAMMYSGIESANPQVGCLTLTNVRVPHSAINLGDWPRISLVIDFRKKEPT